MATKKRKAKAKQQLLKSKKRRGDRLSTFDMCQLVQAKSISSRLELASLATAQVREGKTVLAEFIANRGSKAVDEVIQLIKEFAKAETHLNRFKKTSIELLEEELTGKCIEGCEGRWLTAAEELLQRHEIEKHSFVIRKTTVVTVLTYSSWAKKLFLHCFYGPYNPVMYL